MSAALYSTVFLIVVTIFTFFLSAKFASESEPERSYTPRRSKAVGYFIAIALSLIIGLRPLSRRYFVDMANYNTAYYALSYGKKFKFSFDKENYLFDNLFDWLAANYVEITVFFLIIAAIYFIGYYIAISKLLPGDSLYAFIIFLGAFSTFSYATNGIKAGAAAAIFLCAIAYRDKKWIAALLLFASLGLHHSMIIPLVAYLLALFVKSPKFYFSFWVLCLVIAALHITFFQELFATITTDESAINYLTADASNWGGKTGFRWDFILYSILPIAVGWYAIYQRGFNSPKYNFMLNIYMFSNAIWMLCMYVQFTNRIAYLSWSIYPVVLVYPFFQSRRLRSQKLVLNTLVWVQLLFTLFMSVI